MKFNKGIIMEFIEQDAGFSKELIELKRDIMHKVHNDIFNTLAANGDKLDGQATIDMICSLFIMIARDLIANIIENTEMLNMSSMTWEEFMRKIFKTAKGQVIERCEKIREIKKKQAETNKALN